MPPERQALGQLLYLVLIVAAVVFLWDTRVLLPVKNLVVFFHEASHALMTVFTGGRVGEMALLSQQGGYVHSYGGNRFLILSSGYLGSLVWGSLIYLLAVRTRLDRWIMGGLGLLLMALAALYIRTQFGLVFCLVSGVVMLLLSLKVHEILNELILIFIGATSMMYVPWDIYSDTMARSELLSDARLLAEEFGGTTVMWGGLWMAVSLVVIFLTLRFSLRGKPPRSQQAAADKPVGPGG